MKRYNERAGESTSGSTTESFRAASASPVGLRHGDDEAKKTPGAGYYEFKVDKKAEYMISTLT